MSDFRNEVISLVKQIPQGKVASYGQVAAACGRPRGAREVGWILRGTGGEGLPWWRVINREGRISIKGNFVNTAELQRQLLENDGVEVPPGGIVDMQKYRFNFLPHA